MTRWHKPVGKAAKIILLSSLLLALLVSLLLWYTTTTSFELWVRGRLVNAIEHATGGRAELGRFKLSPFRFAVEIEDLTIHGRENPGEVPLVHVDRLTAVVDLASVLGANIGFHSLTLEHPVVHFILYPDGTSNRPTPERPGGANFEHLFSLSIDKFFVRGGELLWQDSRVPLNFNLNELAAALDYSFLHRRYSGNISVGNAETQLLGERPVAWAAESAFVIGADRVDFERLRVTAGASRLEATGALVNFNHPRLTADYNLALNLAQAGAVARQPELRAGMLEFRGRGSWSEDSFLSSGGFSIQALGWKDNRLNLSNASARGKFSLDPDKFTLSQVEGVLLGGSFSSDAEVIGWRSAAGNKTASRVSQSGSLKVRIKDISLPELTASLGPQFRPVTSLRFAGRISGNSDLHWKNSVKDGEMNLALNVSPPSRNAPNQIPLAGVANGTYDLGRGDIAIRDLFLSSPATSLRAAGNLSSRGTLKFTLTNSDWSEWRGVVDGWFPAGMPLPADGRTIFHGTLAGGFASPSIAANLEMEDVDLAWTPAQPKGLESIHLDFLKSDVQLSAQGISMRNGLLKSAATSMRFEGNAQLVRWSMLPENSIRLSSRLENADAAQLARIFDPKLPITGRASANLEISGSMAHPAGQGTIALASGSIASYAIDRAQASVALNGSNVGVRNLFATRGASQISGSGHYDLVARNFELELVGKDFDLAQLPRPRPSLSLGGDLDFTAQARGSIAQPDVQAHFELRKLTLNQELIGDYGLDAVTHGSELRLTGHSNFQHAELVLEGNVHLRERWPAAIDFHFTRLDVDSFLASYLRSHITGHSAVAGDLRLEGPLLDPELWKWAGNLSDFYAEIEKIKIRNQGPVKFTVSGQTINIESFHILGENTDFTAQGSVELAEHGQLNLGATGKIELRLIENYDPDFTSSGTVTGQARLTGTRDAPVIEGKLQIENGSIADINLPSALSDMNGVFRFSQNQITIDSLQARTGGGSVRFSGHAELVGQQMNFDLAANVDAVRLRYPPGVSSTADAELHWSGSSSGSLLSGDITVTKLGVTPGFDFGAYLERSIQQSSLPQTDPVLNRIRLDLHVTTAPELEMQTSVLRLRGDADLRVRGNAAKPVLLGRGDVFEGEAYFNGTKYRLERGGVSFTNPAITTPFIDLEAVTRVRDYDITLSLNGDVSKPNGLKMNYRSDPPLPTADIISLLAFGQTTETSAQLQQSSQSAFSQQASNAMLAAALNATLNNRAQRLFGNSRIKVDPQGLETETSPTQNGPAVTIEQQVKDNLTLSYTTNVSQTSQQIIRAEYNVTRNLSIVAIRDQNGVVSFDVRIRRRKR